MLRRESQNARLEHLRKVERERYKRPTEVVKQQIKAKTAL